MTTTLATRRNFGVIVFFSIAFGFPWAGWIAVRALAAPDSALANIAFFLLPGAVSLAAFAAHYAEGGVSGVTTFARRAFAARFGALPLVIVLAAPLVAGLLTFVTHPIDLVGQGVPDPAIWLGAMTLINLWTGPLAEEFGWRGYLLPRFEARLPTWAAGLLIGPIWGLWHLPLFYDSVFSSVASAAPYLLWVTAWSVVLAIITRFANGNILPAVALHFVINTQADLFSSLLPRLPGELLPSGLPLALGSAAVAAVLIMLTRSAVSMTKTPAAH